MRFSAFWTISVRLFRHVRDDLLAATSKRRGKFGDSEEKFVDEKNTMSSLILWYIADARRAEEMRATFPPLGGIGVVFEIF